MSIDMYGHGHSDAVTPAEWYVAGTGMYDAVKLMADFPYVDTDKIGVTGHSNGARAANLSIREDNMAEEPLIDSVLLVANDAMYTTSENEPLYTGIIAPDAREPYTNRYGTRDVGIIAAQFDEFFFRTVQADGTQTLPRDFITTEYAQSFLNFGSDPVEVRESGVFYTNRVNGELALRVIYTPWEIHPWNHFSMKSAAQGIEYWEESFGAPNPIPKSNQIWIFKAMFNFIGLVGWVIFIVAFAKVLLFTPAFASLRKDQEPKTMVLNRNGKLWFWIGSAVVAVIAAVSYLNLGAWTRANRPAFLPQAPTYFIGVWSTVVGVSLIVLLVLSYYLYSRKNGYDPKERGIAIALMPLIKTVALAVTVLASAFALVFAVDYFFKADFRFWVLTVRTFSPDKIGIALRYAPLFLLYYIPMSVATNSFNQFKLGDKEWYNTAVAAGFTGLAPGIMIILQYVTFMSTGDVFFKGISNIYGIWLFPIVVIIPVGAIVSRKLYKLTGNPYLGGIIWGLLVPMIMASNTLTQI
ncbi:hypothetical protein L21SP2_2011 [Salinispira pacifica]|uniref:Peptidase S9 prolyl oligopeptidase catalytic domain-containing protein n=2 Tax=Salinispira pacifica TaxID=1307761 RepID=V5WHS6_9SPIO|nr:hypothetical protein L21SP2_2011 [Salinispira pacifica]